MAEGELGLGEAIDVVRSELRQAQDSGRGSDVRFSVGSVEVEFVVEVVKVGGGEASVKVFNVLSLGGKGEVSRGDTNRIKVVLNPVGVGGEPFEVASAQDHRPDLREQNLGSAGAVDQHSRSEPGGYESLAGDQPGS